MKKLVMMIVTAFAALMLVGCGASESGSPGEGGSYC